MHSPAVSVIVTTRDRPRLLADALRSIAAQSRPALEVRLADDGETASIDALPDLGFLELTALVVRCGQPGAARNAAARDARVVRERVREDGVREALESAMLAADWDEERMRTDDYLPPSAWGVRRELFERLGGFDESFACSEDWDFVLRAARATRVRRVPGATVEVRMREHGNASADFGAARRECLVRLAARHGLPPLEPKTFWEVARAMEAGA